MNSPVIKARKRKVLFRKQMRNVEAFLTLCLLVLTIPVYLVLFILIMAL